MTVYNRTMIRTNEVIVIWTPVEDKLPECRHHTCSELMLIALEKRHPEIKPTILRGWYDFERGYWSNQFGQVEARVTHWQELNYPPE